MKMDSQRAGNLRATGLICSPQDHESSWSRI
jgi:hypothetical protein